MTAPLTYTLVAIDELIDETGIPLDRTEAVELFGAVHHHQVTVDGLHDDLAECLEPLDVAGRCTDCGRLVARAHNRRGCAMAIPIVGQVLWLLDGGAYSIPFIGKALWLANRRRVLARKLSVGEDGLPASASPAGPAGIDPPSASTTAETGGGR